MKTCVEKENSIYCLRIFVRTLTLLFFIASLNYDPYQTYQAFYSSYASPPQKKLEATTLLQHVSLR